MPMGHLGYEGFDFVNIFFVVSVKLTARVGRVLNYM